MDNVINDLRATKPKTRKDFFERLPDNIRLEAEEAILLHGDKDLHQTLQEVITDEEDVLGNAFIWATAKQGVGYWATVSFEHYNDFK